MPDWGAVLKEITDYKVHRNAEAATSVDLIRRKYLKRLHAHIGCNIIAYYSGWLSKPDIAQR